MSFQNQNIGMMDEGYFVSRGDILKWINDLLQLNMTKIQQLGSGAVYCQVIDVIHPGKIALNKVNWKAKSDYEFIQNLKILQQAFNKVGIKRYVQVQKLAKAKYQDNLQFAQWLKRYYDLNCGDRGNNYLAQERRGGNNPNFGFAQKNVVPKTYNGSGAIIPKKQSPPKKVVAATEVPPKKVSTAVIPKAVKEIPKRVPKAKEQVGSGSNQKQQKKQAMVQKLKQMQQKLQMIRQILKSEDGSDMKVQMISQVMQIQEQFHQEVEVQKQEHETN